MNSTTKPTNTSRYWLLELLAEAREPQLLPLFLKYLYGPHESLRKGAILGLTQLDTREARQALWEARDQIFTPETST